MAKDYEIVIVAVVDGAGNVLLIRRVDGDVNNPGKWEFPAGHVDPGERPDVAAPREVFEETGLRVYLMPYKIDVPTKKGMAAHYLGMVVGGEVKPDPELAEDEHDASRWVSVDKLDRVKPRHKNMKENLIQILEKVNGHIQPRVTAHKGRAPMGKRRQAVEAIPTRFVRALPGPGEDLKEAIMVGDEVEIFLKEQSLKTDDPHPELKGIVDRRNRNMLWLREEEAKGSSEAMGKSIVWKNDGDWAFIRVYRDPDSVIHYIQRGNPYDPEGGKAMDEAKGIGLILEDDPPERHESMWALMRGETPDLDMSGGQAPQSMDRVAPFSRPQAGTPPILHQVREILRDSGIETDVMNNLGNGRVLILSKDEGIKKEIVKALKDKGVEIKATRLGGLVVRARTRRTAAGGTTTIPIETDDDMMRPTVEQRKRKLLRERKRSAAGTIPFQTDPKTVSDPSKGIAPQVNITLPSQDQQIKALEDEFGPVNSTELPNNLGTTVPLNQMQLQKFQQQMAKNTNIGQPLARRSERWVKKARQLGRGFREAMADADYPVAGEFLSRLVGMGVGEERIIHSRLASKAGWAGLYHYAIGVGEVGVSRVSRRASRLRPIDEIRIEP